MKLKIVAILVVVAALAGGWKWQSPKGTRAAAPPAFVKQGPAVSTTDGWSWGEEA